MSDTIQCHVHGEQQETFVCQHLVEALETGKNVGFYWAGEPRGDAWCSACEAARIREGGATGEWNVRSEKMLGVKILCGACYDRVRDLQGF
jgi:hypothetical protein